MLEIYAREFCGIGRYLKQNNELRKGYILVEKKDLEIMLNKNRYDTAANKLRVWKKLKWIDTEADRRLTKRVYDGASGKYKPYVKMDMAVLEQLDTLISK